MRKTPIVDFWIFLSEKFRIFVSNTKLSRLIRRQEDYRELDLTDILKSVPKSWLIALPGEILKITIVQLSFKIKKIFPFKNFEKVLTLILLSCSFYLCYRVLVAKDTRNSGTYSNSLNTGTGKKILKIMLCFFSKIDFSESEV